MNMKVVAVALGALALAACSETPQDTAKLRAAVDSAKVSLRESVSIAEGSLDHGSAVRATLLTRSKQHSVEASSVAGFEDVRVDLASGEVVSTKSLSGGPGEACPGSVSLSDAIAAAEAEADGDAVTAAPDDDDACDTEVKVLGHDDVLYGSIVESEVADDADETDA
jgi:hypothetical protein